MNLSNSSLADEEARKCRYEPWLWNPGQTSSEVQNRSSLRKRSIASSFLVELFYLQFTADTPVRVWNPNLLLSSDQNK